MIGIFSVLAAVSVAGSVPLLADTARPYDGDIVAPLGSDFSLESTNTVVGIISTIGATAYLIAGNKSAKRQEEEEGLSAGALVSAGEVDLSIPYDAPARLAYEASDKYLDYDEFRLNFEAEAVKVASEKWAQMFSPVKALSNR